METILKDSIKNRDITKIALLAPYFTSEPLENLDATFYHTGSYKGDLGLYMELRELVKGYGGER